MNDRRIQHQNKAIDLHMRGNFSLNEVCDQLCMSQAEVWRPMNRREISRCIAGVECQRIDSILSNDTGNKKWIDNNSKIHEMSRDTTKFNMEVMMKPEKKLKKEHEKQRFMTFNLSEARFKRSIRRLKNYLRDKGYEITLGEIYDAGALLHGYKDWSTMKAIAFHERFEPTDE